MVRIFKGGGAMSDGKLVQVRKRPFNPSTVELVHARELGFVRGLLPLEWGQHVWYTNVRQVSKPVARLQAKRFIVWSIQTGERGINHSTGVWAGQETKHAKMATNRLKLANIPGIFRLIPTTTPVNEDRERINGAEAKGGEVGHMIVRVFGMLHRYLPHIFEQQQHPLPHHAVYRTVPILEGSQPWAKAIKVPLLGVLLQES